MRYLRQSTSADVPIGPFVDATDGVTAETALTLTQPDIRLKKNAAAWAQKAAAQTLSHEENGMYEVTLDATDTDTLGLLRLAVFESGAAPVWEDFLVIQAQEFDRLFTATGQRQLGLVATGTAQSATATTLVLAAAETFADDTVNGMTLVVHGSTQGYSQVRQVTDYVLSSDTATVDTWTVTPSGTITYWLFATPPAVASGTLPAVTVGSGGITTASFAAGAINAAAIASDAITDAKVAADVTIASVTGAVGSVTGAVGSVTGAVGSVTGAVGSVTGNVGGNVVGSVGSVTGAVGSVTAIAANAITAAATAADFGTEIAAAVLAAAAADPIDANVEQINTVAVTGNGVSPKFGV
jgi:hypothetical protein